MLSVVKNGLDIMMKDDFDLALMGSKGYRYVVNNFNWENIAIIFNNLFKGVAKL